MDYKQLGVKLYHFEFPPPIDLEAIKTFGEDLIPVCDQKIKELQNKWEEIDFKRRQYDFLIQRAKQKKLDYELVYPFKAADIGIETQYIKKWIVYWYRTKRFAQKNPIQQSKNLTDEDIERARSFPFDQLLGGKFKAPCPFHEEKSASFMIFKRQNYGKCFGCQWYGSTIDFVMQKESLSFVEAVRSLNV